MARHRRKDRPRTRSGRLSRAYASIAKDSGTPELVAKRQALVGEGADPNLSTSMAGILFARGILEQHHYSAAIGYRSLYCLLFGSPWPSNVESWRIPSDNYLRKAQNRFLSLTRAVDSATLSLMSAVCVYDQPPAPPQKQILTQGLSRIAGLVAST